MTAPDSPSDRLLRELERQRLRTRRLEAVGRLAVGVARDVDQLASSVLACTSTLAQELAADEQITRSLNLIRVASERSAALARQLIALGEVGRARPEAVDVGEAIQRVSELLGSDVELELVQARDLAPAWVDRGHLEELIVALLVGARNGIPAGGRLRIETGNVAIDAGQAASAGPPSGHYIVVSVLGRDGAVKVWLPRSEPLVSPPEPRVPAVLPGGFETVLLVEDDARARGRARHILKARGYRVVEVGSSRQALRASARHPEPFAALIASVVLPELNGYMLAERLRADRPDLKVLFLSSYPGRSSVEGTIPLRGAAFLSKPFTAASLSIALRRLLDDPGACSSAMLA